MNVANNKTLVLEETDSGCIVPTSHKLNQDGYFRKQVRHPDGVVRPVMYHRWVWESVNGPIPDGYEIDHVCRNRACCNTEHLQLLTVTEHKVKTNRERYAERLQAAKEYWIKTQCTGTELGKIFGVTYSSGCKWIRNWKSE